MTETYLAHYLLGYQPVMKPWLTQKGPAWENGFIESFNGKMRVELLNGENFYSLKEAQILIEMLRRKYNILRSHSSLGYQPPALVVIVVQFTQLLHVGLNE